MTLEPARYQIGDYVIRNDGKMGCVYDVKHHVTVKFEEEVNEEKGSAVIPFISSKALIVPPGMLRDKLVVFYPDKEKEKQQLGQVEKCVFTLTIQFSDDSQCVCKVEDAQEVKSVSTELSPNANPFWAPPDSNPFWVGQTVSASPEFWRRSKWITAGNGIFSGDPSSGVINHVKICVRVVLHPFYKSASSFRDYSLTEFRNETVSVSEDPGFVVGQWVELASKKSFKQKPLQKPGGSIWKNGLFQKPGKVIKTMQILNIKWMDGTRSNKVLASSIRLLHAHESVGKFFPDQYVVSETNDIHVGYIAAVNSCNQTARVCWKPTNSYCGDKPLPAQEVPLATLQPHPQIIQIGDLVERRSHLPPRYMLYAFFIFGLALCVVFRSPLPIYLLFWVCWLRANAAYKNHDGVIGRILDIDHGSFLIAWSSLNRIRREWVGEEEIVYIPINEKEDGENLCFGKNKNKTEIKMTMNGPTNDDDEWNDD